jgi:septum formation protein
VNDKLVLSTARQGTDDEVVFTHAQPITLDTAYSVLPDANQELLEKPSSKEDNLRMLLDLNGGLCEVVTGPVIGATSFDIG